MKVRVIGAGLAGCEAAWQLAKRGAEVELVEMKPAKKTPAHKTDMLAELVCSNSFKAARINSAAGLLKEEMRRMGSLLMECADRCSVAAGGALAVDRTLFSSMVTEKIKSCDRITLCEAEITKLPEDGINVIATGPLTSDALAEDIRNKFGGSLSFFDAAAPIVSAESIDMEHAFAASRYGKGDGDDYIRIVSVRCVVPVDGIAIVTSVHECRGIFGIGESQCCPVGGGVADEYLVVHAGIEEQTLLVVHDGIVLEGEVLSG